MEFSTIIELRIKCTYKDDSMVFRGGEVRRVERATNEEAFLIGSRLRAENSRAVPGQGVIVDGERAAERREPRGRMSLAMTSP